MTAGTGPEPTSPRQMTCVRRLYEMQDDTGLRWLAVEPGIGPAEGGVMSHRVAPGGPGEQTGGVMSHLAPGDTTEVEGDDADQRTVLVPPQPGGMPQRLQAYRLSPALLPTGEDPAGT